MASGMLGWHCGLCCGRRASGSRLLQMQMRVLCCVVLCESHGGTKGGGKGGGALPALPASVPVAPSATPANLPSCLTAPLNLPARPRASCRNVAGRRLETLRMALRWELAPIIADFSPQFNAGGWWVLNLKQQHSGRPAVIGRMPALQARPHLTLLPARPPLQKHHP